MPKWSATSSASASSCGSLWHGMITPTTCPGAAIWHSRTHDRRVDAAAQADDEAARARGADALLQPVRDDLRASRAVHAELAQVAGQARGWRCSMTRRNASTSVGSNWRPRCRSISAIASATGHAALYGRFCVSASNTSATATMRPASGMRSPAMPA